MLFCFQNQNSLVGFMHLKLLFKPILANKIFCYIAVNNHILNYLARFLPFHEILSVIYIYIYIYIYET